MGTKRSLSQQGWPGQATIDGVVLRDGDVSQTDRLSEPGQSQGLAGGAAPPVITSQLGVGGGAPQISPFCDFNIHE